MYREVAKLIIYGNHEDTILMKMSDIFKKFDRDEETPDKLISDIYEQIIIYGIIILHSIL